MIYGKKSSIVILILTSSYGFSGTMGSECTHSNISIPCEKNSWFLGAKALYLQSFSGGESSERQFTNTKGGHITEGQSAKWGWGFMVEGAYNFSTGNDINLNWYHIDTTHAQNRNASGVFAVSDIVPLANTSGTSAVRYVDTDSKIQWDSVNLEFGQIVNYSAQRTIRVHGDISYGRIYTNYEHTTLATNTTSTNVVREITSYRLSSATFNGVGPRLGADLAYNWRNIVSIYAKGAAALLAGVSDYNYFKGSSGLTIQGSNTFVVPELDGKLGLSSSFKAIYGDLSVDLGWMWVNYINSLSTKNVSVSESPSFNSFTTQGPFVGLRWSGDMI